jgi:hypothetical protein
MKSSLAIALVLSAAAVSAQAPQNQKAENFQEQKAFVSQILDKRIAALSEAKSCVAGAADREALRKCHEELKDDRQAIKQEIEGFRRENKAEHEERKAEREKRQAEREQRKDERKKN